MEFLEPPGRIYFVCITTNLYVKNFTLFCMYCYEFVCSKCPYTYVLIETRLEKAAQQHPTVRRLVLRRKAHIQTKHYVVALSGGHLEQSSLHDGTCQSVSGM